MCGSVCTGGVDCTGVGVPGLDVGMRRAEVDCALDGLVAGVGYEIDVGVYELAMDEAEAFGLAGCGNVGWEGLVKRRR